jgi:hypothetical protein
MVLATKKKKPAPLDLSDKQDNLGGDALYTVSDNKIFFGLLCTRRRRQSCGHDGDGMFAVASASASATVESVP